MTSQTAAHDGVEVQAIQRRTLTVLFASAIFGRAGLSIVFAVAALLIKEILNDGTWAGMSTAAITVGTAFSASILSNYMNRHGRRPGLSIGYLAATVGGVVAVLGGQKLNLLAYLFGLMLLGVGSGVTNLARYAAADLAEPANRGKAISSVVFASTAGAVVGPAMVGLSGRWAESLNLDKLVGPFILGGAMFAVAGLVLWIWLRPDPLVVSGGLRVETEGLQRGGFREGWQAIMANPMAQLAASGLALSQAVMVMVMAMTPLHMDDHGHSLGTIGWVISAHTAGMYAFAPLAGWASDRFGRLPTLATGGVTLAAATVFTTFAESAPSQLMFPGLFLLGLGWSLSIISASALLTESVASTNQVSAQGSADVLTSVVSGTGALVSGVVLAVAGFNILSLIGLTASGILIALCFYRSWTTPITTR